MSSVCTLPRLEASRDGPPAAPEAAATAVEFHYAQTDTILPPEIKASLRP
jgi:hypothetical protein